MSPTRLSLALLFCGLLAAPAAHAGGAPVVRVVTTTADSGVGSLREQLTNAQAGDVVQFDDTLFATPQTIELQSALPALATDLSLLGPGANLLTLRRADAAPPFRILRAGQFGGTVTIAGLTVANGHAPTSAEEGGGGGILIERPFLVDGVHVTGNRADGNGGGMLTNTVGGTIINSTFSNNATTTTGTGGALVIQPAAAPVRIVNSTFSGNTALAGGAISVFAFLPFAAPGNVELTGVTVHGNLLTSPVNASGRAALRIDAVAGGTTTLTLRNTLFSNNDGSPIHEQNDGSITSVVSADFNLADMNITGYLNAPNDLPGANPGLAPLADNGGPTPTHALLPDSDAIDAGSNEGSTILTDQRGFARTVDLPVPQLGDSDATDIGAFESEGELPPLEPAIFADGFEDG